ncbi:LysR family transcriptional regulator [Burkholderia stabilis]|uniref:HTH-type transcriptional regulator gltC,DNA-binding transcriptional regulator CynR,aminoethylphosphonate catabolism associated LysR family transcriptional regulator,LysR substrate binding domain n=1 Tax=Burkholderia stabilis TaxID=95485 RepID=A0AAJ5NAP7_9BURK|nr:LysR family transcriptional regulator [Burkholderia stabilis]VBB14833.1 HTH-type transcriptional regulator gltC,DNA-binding transcriptional regulator CynR,aminoethylphosphonate catabolism associated LysR family transcriptional regulator,LysR substrate binding domain [Burkholderia stabilis]
MDVGRLRALLELERCGTMAAAAEALFLTPSAVSQQIAQLEEEAGVELTERVGRGVRLTPAGHALAGYAGRVMVVLDEARSELAELRREIAGELRVAAFPSIASVVLPDTVKELRRAFPRLSIEIEELEPIDAVAALRSWRADIALIDDLSIAAGNNRENIEVVPLAEDALYVAVATDHPLSKKSSLTIADLRQETWAIESTWSTFGSFVADLCRRAGYEPRINAKCRGSEMVEAMVASGCSVSVAPGLRVLRAPAGVAWIKLKPEVRRKIYVAYRRGERSHPTIRVFVDEIVRTTARLLG